MCTIYYNDNLYTCNRRRRLQVFAVEYRRRETWKNRRERLKKTFPIVRACSIESQTHELLHIRTHYAVPNDDRVLRYNSLSTPFIVRAEFKPVYTVR